MEEEFRDLGRFGRGGLVGGVIVCTPFVSIC